MNFYTDTQKRKPTESGNPFLSFSTTTMFLVHIEMYLGWTGTGFGSDIYDQIPAK